MTIAAGSLYERVTELSKLTIDDWVDFTHLLERAQERARVGPRSVIGFRLSRRRGCVSSGNDIRGRLSMSPVETDQAAREASGSHEYGRYLEEFEVGKVYKHWPAKTVTEGDHHLFCLVTMNHHPLHLNDVYASRSQQGRNVVAGPLVYSLAFGMTVGDISGKAIANLATEELSHPAPVFHGDTLFVESEVLEKRESHSKPDRGTVKVHTRVLNQDGVLVAEFKRVVLVPRKQPAAAPAR
jgi:acyl dehydratase